MGLAGLTLALAAVPLAVTLARGDPVVTTPLIIVGLVGGAALGWAVEDPAAELLASMPLSSPVRMTLRSLLVALVALVGIGIILITVALGPGLPSDLYDRLPEAAAAGAVALSVGLVAAHNGDRGAGSIGVIAGVLGPACVAVLAFRWPAILPTLASGPTHERWWIVVATCSVILAATGRDPGRGAPRIRVPKGRSAHD